MRRGYCFLWVLGACATQLPVLASASVAPAPVKAARPTIGPVPEWAASAEIPPPPTGAEGAATIDLLADHQTKFTAEGDSTYFDLAFKIATPQGLQDAALQIDWDPALETLTLHRYRILRDGKVLDLLGDGSKLSILQREENMENAALDGRLTASMQPDDVRVGDVVEIAFTRTRRDPALGGMSEAMVGPNDGNSYGRLRFRMIWPDTKKMQWRTFPGVVQPKLIHTAAGNELIADITNVRTPLPPKGAPARFLTVNAIDVSEFPDWRSVALTMLPFYTEAAKLGPNSEVRTQARRIAAATADPKRRAEMALALVQDQIRYLFLGMDDGGYVPAGADLTWSRRFGDCKGKAVLLMALLRELGVEAEPVLVNTERGDLVGARLPSMDAFDHVIVRAKIAGRTYWMDGTRLGDTRLDDLRTPAYHFGLPVNANITGLLPLAPEPLTEPSETVSLALDATAGIDAPAGAKGEMRFRGQTGTDMRMKYAGLSATDLDQQLRELWRKNYDFVTPASFNTTTDSRTGDFVIDMTGTAKMDWLSDADARWYELDKSRLGWKFDTDRDGAIVKDASFEIEYPDYWESRETIKLPDGGKGFKLQGGSIDEVVDDVYAMHRKVEISDGVVQLETSTRALLPELAAARAEQMRTDLNALSNKGVYVRVPDEYMATSADIAALQGNKTALVEALLHRGAVHFDRQEWTQSVADEEAALAVDSSKAAAQAIRALALAVLNDPKAAAAADSALALDAKQSLAWRAKGIIAVEQKRYADADIAYSKQLELDPKNVEAMFARASTRLLLGHFAEALNDLDATVAISPVPKVRIVRAAALLGTGRSEDALAEADRAVQGDPIDRSIREARAEMRANLGKRELAVEDLDELIKQAPKSRYYLARAALWSATDHARRDADIEAALRLDPSSQTALAYRASTEIKDGDFARAQTDIAKLEQTDLDGRNSYLLRVQLLEKQGRTREALDLVNAFVAKHPADAVALNERCWTKATLNIQLDTALADCNASLKLAPDSAATLDSRGFTKLRLGDNDAAIADYDAALRLSPGQAASLYGRAIARARKGDFAAARADLAAVRGLGSDIESRFAGFGMALPVTLPNSPADGDTRAPN